MAKRIGKLKQLCWTAEFSERKSGLDFPDGGRVFFDRIKRLKGEKLMARFLNGYLGSLNDEHGAGWNAWSVGGELKALVANTKYKPTPFEKNLIVWHEWAKDGSKAGDHFPVLKRWMANYGYTVPGVIKLS